RERSLCALAIRNAGLLSQPSFYLLGFPRTSHFSPARSHSRALELRSPEGTAAVTAASAPPAPTTSKASRPAPSAAALPPDRAHPTSHIRHSYDRPRWTSASSASAPSPLTRSEPKGPARAPATPPPRSSRPANARS